MSNKILVIGCGGLLKQIFPHIHSEIISDNIVFLDETNNTNISYGCKLIKSFDDIPKDITHFIVAVSSPKNRREITDKCLKKDLISTNIIASDVRIPDSCKLGTNNIILNQVILEENIEIGSGNLINLGCYLCHDSKIGLFNELAPRVTLLGNSKICHETFIGAGTIIREKIKIGNFVTIGMGSNVLKDVPNNCVAYGNPCKIKYKNLL